MSSKFLDEADEGMISLGLVAFGGYTSEEAATAAHNIVERRGARVAEEPLGPCELCGIEINPGDRHRMIAVRQPNPAARDWQTVMVARHSSCDALDARGAFPRRRRRRMTKG